MTGPQQLLVALAAVLVLGIGSQWLAWRFRIPSIVLLLVVGFLAGPGLGLIDPDALFGPLLLPFTSLAVALILFEGGLSLRFSELRGAGGSLWALVTVGAAVTWGLTSVAAYWLLPLEPAPALLLGAILVVTGPTVVLPLLRQIRPIGRVGAVAKWEGIVIDPVGAVLAVLVFEASTAVHGTGLGEAAREAALGLVQTLVLGAALGGIGAIASVQVLRRFWIPDFLQSPVLLMGVLAAFTVSNLVRDESGLLTVTLMGVALANQRSVSVKHIVEFKENLRVLLISTLFILLAARVEARDFGLLGWRGPILVAVLVLVIRPLAVYVSTLFSGLAWKERAFLAWLAPRGIVAAAVSAVFALRLGARGEILVPATFMVIIGTVTLYGLTAGPLARRLGLSNEDPQGIVFASAHPGARAMAHAVKAAGFPVLLVDNNPHNLRHARMEGLPTLFASVLSEQALDGLEQGGLGRLLAMTPNDEVNALAAVHFREVFGRAEIYQLPPQKETGPRRETAPTHLRGRYLFAPQATYGQLDERFAQGAIVKSTRLSREFDYQAFRERHGEAALPLFVVSEAGSLLVCTADRPPAPRPGQTVIALVEAPADRARRGSDAPQPS